MQLIKDELEYFKEKIVKVMRIRPGHKISGPTEIRIYKTSSSCL